MSHFDVQCYSAELLSVQVGWAISSGHIIKHMKTIHQNTVYHCATPAQVLFWCSKPSQVLSCSATHKGLIAVHFVFSLLAHKFCSKYYRKWMKGAFWIWEILLCILIFNRKLWLVGLRESMRCLGLQRATSSSCQQCCTTRRTNWPLCWRVWVWSPSCQREDILWQQTSPLLVRDK